MMYGYFEHLAGYVYLVRGGGLFKIGMTKNLRHRVGGIVYAADHEVGEVTSLTSAHAIAWAEEAEPTWTVGRQSEAEAVCRALGERALGCLFRPPAGKGQRLWSAIQKIAAALKVPTDTFRDQ